MNTPHVTLAAREDAEHHVLASPTTTFYEDRGAITALAKLRHDLHAAASYDAADGAPDQPTDTRAQQRR
jgi:hypothetical protein